MSKRAGSKGKIKAVAYTRTSSAANVGADKDSVKRQRAAIERYAKTSGYVIEPDDWFDDPAVSGADPIDTRDGFKALLARIDGNGVRTVLIEDLSRFARDLVTQEMGIALMIGRGVKVITANGDDQTITDDPMRKAMRQIAGAFSELEKSRLVGKLKAARDRKRATGARVEGRRPLAETHPEAVAMARRLAHGNRKEKLSLREISAELAKAGHLNTQGRPFGPSVVKKMTE
ncbi:MAG: recombinase family protein [Proteobacteria bacterium]|nr:recombinase family protein [Pseudomonadota bacterium]